jgi:hypothetical protein
MMAPPHLLFLSGTMASASRALSRLSSQRVVAIRRLTRSLSSRPPPKMDEEDDEFKHPQEFVKTQFEPGEWDPFGKDPLFKPPFKSRAKIMSAEDYAKAPLVGFEEEVDSLRDAMVTLTWLDANDTDKIYEAYLEIMSKSTGKTTSHEYVMRLIAQRFNLTSQRVAAIVELAHREDQHRKNGKKIYYDAQAYVDAKIKEHIRTAYSEFGELDPQEFVEDPMGVTGMGDPDTLTGSMIDISDVIDVDAHLEATLIREQKDARVKIDGHIYKEDVDDNQFHVKISAEAQKLLNTAKSFTNSEDSQRPGGLNPAPGSHPRRDRWKYAALTVNTRDAKKNRKKSYYRKKEISDDIMVEQDGELRLATIAEVKETCWKPKRNFQEFSFSGVKAAWLERSLRGETGGWGRQQAPEPEEEPVAEITAEAGDDSEEGGDTAEEDSSEDEATEEGETPAEEAKEESKEESSDAEKVEEGSDDKKE